jgi:hypothetical protein
MRRIALATVLTAAVFLPLHEAQAKYCPRVLYRATRLVVVSVPTMQASGATVRTYERNSPASSWEQRSAAEPAVVGNGIAWGDIFESFAKKGEPVKREGDQRAPAGIFRISATPGATVPKLPGYLPLVPTKQLCAEESARPSAAQDASIIDSPGACIVLDIWGHPDAGADARIALPESRVAFLRNWTAHRFTAIAIVSEDTISRYNGCLPDPAGTSDAARVPLPVRKSTAMLTDAR